MVGLLDTQAIPSLKELFRDEDIGCAAYQLVGEKCVIHSQIFGRVDKSKLEKVQTINIMIDETFKRAGLSELYTWAETDEQYRFNQFLGYKPTGMEVVTTDYKGPTIYEFMKTL